MKKVDSVELKMKKALCTGAKIDEHTFVCELLRYDSKRENLYLEVETSDLTMFSLDAIYECRLQSGLSVLECTGRIKERYCQGNKKVIKFEIENGFYKNNIKLVDKQMS
ncbi:MAG: hypothetical protein U0L59_00375 [Faecalimonas sp.]|nr:hypothetical protein [Faecalimonas sp.]